MWFPDGDAHPAAQSPTWSSSPAVHNYGMVSRLLLLPLHSGNNVNHPSPISRDPDLRPSVEVEVPNVLGLLFLTRERCQKETHQKQKPGSMAFIWLRFLFHVTHRSVSDHHVFESERFTLRISSQLHHVISKCYAALWWPILETLFLVGKITWG